MARLAATLLTASFFSSLSFAQIPWNNDDTSARNAANIVKEQMLTFYSINQPNHETGVIDGPFYWWEGGAMFGQLIQHWALTGNDTYNDMISAGILAQIGAGQDFEPHEFEGQLGNDDQQFWAFTVMDAAETNFPNPPSGQPGWLALGQAVFNRQVPRFQTQQCNGGLRWQVPALNIGYDYKNVPANGGLAQLGARLARFTGNQTYADWATKLWDWVEGVGYISLKPAAGSAPSYYLVYDGAHVEDNCTDVNEVQFTYNSGTLLSATAYMYDFTKDSIWETRATNLVNGIFHQFTTSNTATVNTAPAYPGVSGSTHILYESAGETTNPPVASFDQPSFKAFLTRSLFITAQLVPSLQPLILPIFAASAPGAARQCAGTSQNGQPGNTWCGRRWYQAAWDGQNGLGEQMSAMAIFQAHFFQGAQLPLTGNTGGTSQGNAGAGTSTNEPPPLPGVFQSPITMGDQVGAAILTVVVAILGGLAVWFMFTGV